MKITKLSSYIIIVVFSITLFNYSGHFLLPKRIDHFGLYEQDDLDVIFFGSSHAQNTFNPHVFFQEESIKSYVYASPGQEIWQTYYYIKEALRVHNPKIIIVELYSTHYEGNEKTLEVSTARNAFDQMQFNHNKIELIRNSSFDRGILSYFNFFTYHDEWKKLNKTHFKYTPEAFKGYYADFSHYSPDIGKKPFEPKPLSNLVKDNLIKIIHLCKEEQVELLFTFAPFQPNTPQQAILTELEKFSDSLDIEFVNFMDSQILIESKFDFYKDLRDPGHLNYYGGIKTSRYMAHRLAKNHVFNSDINTTYSNSRFIKKSHNILNGQLNQTSNLNQYLDLLSNKNVFIAATFSGTNLVTLTNDHLEAMRSQTNNSNIPFKNYIGLFNPVIGISDEYFDTLGINKYWGHSKSKPFDLTIQTTPNHQSRIKANNIDLIDLGITGLNLAVFDELGKVINISNFNGYSDNPKRTTIGRSFNTFLNEIKNRDVIVLIASYDSAEKGLQKGQFNKFGSTIDWKNMFRHSYIGFFNPKRKQCKEISGKDLIEMSTKDLSEYTNLDIKIISQGLNDLGQTSAAIELNGKNILLTPNRGLNIALIDPHSGELLELVSFDTYGSDNPFGTW